MFKNMKKKFAAAAVALGLSSAALAEGTGNTIDLSVATTQLTAMKDSIVAWITSAAPVLVGILGAALVVLLIWKGFAWIKKGTNKA